MGHRKLCGGSDVTLNGAMVVVHPLPAMLPESVLLYSCFCLLSAVSCAHEFLMHHVWRCLIFNQSVRFGVGESVSPLMECGYGEGRVETV